MSTNSGIFESFPSQAVNRQDSPFAVVQNPQAQAPAPQASPFVAVARQDSPFVVVDGADARQEYGKPVKIPERRKVESPFQAAEPTEGFGFEAAPTQQAAAPAPAAVAPASPFSVAEAFPAARQAAAMPAFANWQESAPQQAAPAAPAAFVEPVAPAVHVPSAFAPAPQPAAQAPAPAPAQVAQAQAPAPTPAAAPAREHSSDSANIRQLELRAIFGVDREMNADEILQRSRALPGMKNIARLTHADLGTIEALRTLLPNLGFGSGSLRLYTGSVPIEFIREGSVMLAVQTDGGFAPGVRETLMIVARELSRIG